MAEQRRLKTMEREVIDVVMGAIQDLEFRDIGARVSKEWRTMESETRQHVTIDLCNKCPPARLARRYPGLRSLMLKGKPRAAEYTTPTQDGDHVMELIPDQWGGNVEPWLEYFSTHLVLRNLKSLQIKRMNVTDQDLRNLAKSHGKILEVLKIENCSGFSTDGLLAIVTSSKRNLKTLDLQQNIIQNAADSRWLQELANNRVLESLVFFNTTLQQVSHGDLQNLIQKCPNITSLKTSFGDINKLGTLFSSTNKLREFWCSQWAGGEQDLGAPLSLPEQLCSLCIGNIKGEAMKLLVRGSTASKLTELNLMVSMFSKNNYCELIRLCPNLKVLFGTNVIGDDGLVELGSCCPRLRKIRIEDATGEHQERITDRGLLALAVGCKQLQKIVVYAHKVTSETLSTFGLHSRNLRDFRIALVRENAHIEDHIILDNGVADLLRGCANLEKFALGLNHVDGFLLTEDGLGYIGSHGKKLKWMLLNGVGDTRVQEPIQLFVRESCQNLRKIELVHCNISANALARAVENLPKLTSLLVQDSAITLQKIIADKGAIDRMSRPYWHMEYIAPTDGSPNGAAHILGYYSPVLQPRTDSPHDGSVVHLAQEMYL